MRRSGTATKYPGVLRVGPKTYRVRAKVKDPRTGKRKEIDRLLTDVTLQQAARKRGALLRELEGQTAAVGERVRVGEFARSWMRSKALKLDQGTSERYATALDLHILPALGDFYFDALASRDVQAWVDAKLVEVIPGRQRPYSVQSVQGWFRVLRTMTRDAVEELELRRDPTRRISFPEAREPDQANALTAEELRAFISAMWQLFPQHLALTVLLAYTGLRFCHASALRWEDWDEAKGLLRVVPKQVRGRVGPISRKKPAPRLYPVGKELAAVLGEHRVWLEVNSWPGRQEGFMFPSSNGKLRSQSSMSKAWKRCLTEVGIKRRFTIHGLRYTFTDLVRQANVDPVVRRAMTGHVTKVMQQHYSSVQMTEMRDAVNGVHQLAPLTPVKRVPEHAGVLRRRPKHSLSEPGGDSGGDGRISARTIGDQFS